MFDFTLCTTWTRPEGRTFYANKTIGLVDGVETTIRDYDNVTYWTFAEKSVPNVEAFAAALDWLGDRPTMMIIRGAVRDGVDLTLGQYRRCADPDENNNTLRPAHRRWVGFDFDDLMGPGGLGARGSDYSSRRVCTGVVTGSLLGL
jgi:hypothetical protein